MSIFYILLKGDAKRLSVPVVLVIFAIKNKEQSLKSQLAFGFVAIILALPIILIK